ncbi:hypothetical protein [Embleya scabrispora]|uniref:hypothetical protein n=1 Tax=Embleya scabrispora TaxID=159449 RepID=UPI00037FF854
MPDSTAQAHHGDSVRRIDAAEGALAGRCRAPPLLLGAGELPAPAGVRPRLREYR